MSVQEVMKLGNRLHDYVYYNLILTGLIFLFLITAIGLAFLPDYYFAVVFCMNYPLPINCVQSLDGSFIQVFI